MSYISVDTLRVMLSDKLPHRDGDLWQVKGGHYITLPLTSLKTIFRIDLSWKDEPLKLTNDYFNLLLNGETILVKPAEDENFNINVPMKIGISTDKPYYINLGTDEGIVSLEFDYPLLNRFKLLRFNAKTTYPLVITVCPNSGKIVTFDVDSSVGSLELQTAKDSLLEKLKVNVSNDVRQKNNIEFSFKCVEEILKKLSK